MKKIARGVGILMWIAGALVALSLAATFAPTFFGLETLIVESDSMGRTLPVGSVALTREVDAHSIGVGDVISFRHRDKGTTTTHRVIALRVDGSQLVFTTKGDSSGSADPEPVIVDGRIHRLEYVVPGVGYIVRYARSPAGLLLFIVLPILGLIVERRWRSARRPRVRPAPSDVGWSTTTYELALLAPDAVSRIATG